jgi:hypothetical protein
MPRLTSFETGRKTQTQSSAQPGRAEAANGSLVLLEKEPRLRGQHTRRRLRKNLHPRSSEARRESFCPLDKDLSWKSAHRTAQDGRVCLPRIEELVLPIRYKARRFRCALLRCPFV